MDLSKVAILLALGMATVGAVYYFKPALPSIPAAYLSPTKQPEYTSPTETTQYSNPPASDPDEIAKNLPPIDLAPVCNMSTIEEFNSWAWRSASSSDFPAALTGIKALAGCFAP